MSKRSLSMILALCMLIPAFSGMSAYAVGEESETESSVFDPMSQVPAENAYEKIHFYFDTAEHANLESVSELATATASVKTNYATALGVAQRRSTDADVNENVYITVQFVSDYMEDETYQTLKVARENAKTADERDEAKTRMNQYSKQYHADLVAENLPTLSAIPYTALHAIDYSSFVTLTVPAASLDTAVLEEVADQDNILHISLTDGFEVVSESSANVDTNENKTGWQDVLECINATEVLQETNSSGEKLHTGEGVKVGIYEMPIMNVGLEATDRNICDISHSNIESMYSSGRFIYRTESNVQGGMYPDLLTHATQVASILTCMLPEATFYFTHVPDYDSCSEDNFYIEGLAWFIENNCDVVNCSFGIESTQYRYDYDAVYDYEIKTHDIVVVVATGNRSDVPSMQVASPARAHNVIAVGGVKYSPTYGWVHAENACYIASSQIVKPNVSAPYNVYIPNIEDMFCGTSASAPLVAACAALYYEYHYEYVSSAAVPSVLVRAVLTASANKTNDYIAVSDYHLADEKVGAGIVNLGKMLSTGVGFSVFTVQCSSTTEFKSISITLTAGAEVCVALNWNVSTVPIMYESALSGSIDAPDIDMLLYNPNGTVVARSICSGNSSAEYIRYTVTTTGTYRVVLCNCENYTVTQQYGFAYKK